MFCYLWHKCIKSNANTMLIFSFPFVHTHTANWKHSGLCQHNNDVHKYIYNMMPSTIYLSLYAIIVTYMCFFLSHTHITRWCIFFLFLSFILLELKFSTNFYSYDRRRLDRWHYLTVCVCVCVSLPVPLLTYIWKHFYVRQHAFVYIFVMMHMKIAFGGIHTVHTYLSTVWKSTNEYVSFIANRRQWQIYTLSRTLTVRLSFEVNEKWYIQISSEWYNSVKHTLLLLYKLWW